jgi:hypothetical protein
MATADTERRQHSRADIELPAQLVRVGGRALAGSASTVDLSEGGARLVGPATFAVGDVVVVTIASGDLSIEHQGLIVGRQPLAAAAATLHVAFKTVEEEARRNIRRLIDLA